MYNINGIRDCRELLEISPQSKISKTERIHTKNAIDVWKRIFMWECILYDEANKKK